VTPDDVERAARDLRPHLSPTPLQYSRAFTDKARCHVHVKVESIQPIRAFKVRGALNRVMHISPEQRRAGVITASAGNHGMGVAYAAATFQVPATVYVPETANPFKVEAIRRLGAQVIAAGRNYNGAYLEALHAQAETGATFVHAYDDPHVVAGQGTIGLEILADLEDVDTVLVPVGGGGDVIAVGVVGDEGTRGGMTHAARLLTATPSAASDGERLDALGCLGRSASASEDSRLRLAQPAQA